MNQITYCSCHCGTPITDAAGVLLPAAQLAENFVFDYDGLDYIELFHVAHVHGQTLRGKDGKPYTVIAPRFVVRVEHPTVTLETQLDAVSARYAVHAAVHSGLVVSCRPQQPGEPDLPGVREVPADPLGAW